MELSHTFTVPASLDTTWQTFMDLEKVGSCFPGATVTEVRGDEFTGTCKVRLGPIALLYAGTGRFVERDATAYRAVIEGRGKDRRGNGTAGATVTIQLSDAGNGSTQAEVHTDLSVTGKPAQFGRGVMQDVSDALLQGFVACLESSFAEPPPEQAPAPSAEATGMTTTSPDATRESSAATRSTRQDDALDLGATVLPVLARSYAKYLAALLAGILIGVLLRGRRAR